MSKKVRYAIGAAGLAPAAALLMPGVARAAQADANVANVALAPSARHSAKLPDAGCTGSVWIQSPKTGSEYLGLWHAWYSSQSECVGTVKTHMSLGDYLWATNWRVKVHDSKSTKTTVSHAVSHETLSLAIHKLYNGHPNVCSALGASDGNGLKTWHDGYCVVPNNP